MTAVVGPNCSMGYVSGAEIAASDDLVKIWDTPDQAHVVGYFHRFLGWFTPDEVEAPGFGKRLSALVQEAKSQGVVAG